MVNVNKLKAKIVERALNVEAVAGMMSIDKSTLYRHLNSPDEITIREADEMSRVLGMTRDEAMVIFFSQFVA